MFVASHHNKFPSAVCSVTFFVIVVAHMEMSIKYYDFFALIILPVKCILLSVSSGPNKSSIQYCYFI